MHLELDVNGNTMSWWSSVIVTTTNVHTVGDVQVFAPHDHSLLGAAGTLAGGGDLIDDVAFSDVASFES